MKEVKIQKDSEMVDRISKLPDCILSHILSFLSTKNAVATGILSHRWKFLWTMVLDLSFSNFDPRCDKDFDHYMRMSSDQILQQKFVHFVNNVLNLRKPETINRFSLDWSRNCVPCHVIAWINTAIASNVEELFVHASTDYWGRNWGRKSVLEIPHGIFTCKRLKTLELDGRLAISAPIMVCLPRLEILKLTSVNFDCEKAFQKLINGCPMLKSLYLYCGIFIPAAIVVSLPRLETLQLHAVDHSVFFESEEAFQKLLNGCPLLKSLVLYCDICISAAIVISLPRLETLKLHSVKFECGEALQCLISGCPVLKYLYISKNIDKDMESISNAFTFMVSSSSLRHLELHVSCKHFRTSYCSLELETPSLQFFKVHDCVSRILVKGSMSSLVEAYFSILSNLCDDKPLDENFSNSIVEAVRAFNCAKSITLSNHVMRALSSAKINLSTKFKRLKKLIVDANCGFWSPLQEFIQCSDVLEALTFNKVCGCSEAWEKHCWRSPEQVPVCLSKSLKLATFPSFEGFPDEIAMVGYILKHGSVLQVVDIASNYDYRCDKRDLWMLREISKFSRKSPVCELKFH